MAQTYETKIVRAYPTEAKQYGTYLRTTPSRSEDGSFLHHERYELKWRLAEEPCTRDYPPDFESCVRYTSQ